MCALPAAGPVPDEGDYTELWEQEFPEEHEGSIGVDGWWIPDHLLQERRHEEMTWIDRQGVYSKVPAAECHRYQGRPYTLNRVDDMKGDKSRSILVVREVKKAKQKEDQLSPSEVFSAMPPVESLEMLVSHWMTEQVDESGAALELAMWDVSRAHFFGEAQRWVYTSLPPGYEEPGYVARLNRTMYGTQDAGRIWMETWVQELVKRDIKMGRTCPALLRGDRVCGFCHGDDFCVVGSGVRLAWFDGLLKKRFAVRKMGQLRAVGESLTILNRTVRLTGSGAEVEPTRSTWTRW